MQAEPYVAFYRLLCMLDIPCSVLPISSRLVKLENRVKIEINELIGFCLCSTKLLSSQLHFLVQHSSLNLLSSLSTKFCFEI